VQKGVGEVDWKDAYGEKSADASKEIAQGAAKDLEFVYMATA